MSTLTALALIAPAIAGVLVNPTIPEDVFASAMPHHEERFVIRMDGITVEPVDKSGAVVRRLPDTSGMSEDKPLEVCVPETAAAFTLAGGSLWWVKRRVAG